MKTLVASVIDTLKSGKSAVLCSIIKQSGSSPRGAGAKMAVFEGGRFTGTIGGGTVEHIAIQHALKLLDGKAIAGFATYNMEGSALNNTDMICGGIVTVSYLVLTPDRLAVFEKFSAVLSGNCNAWLYMRFDEETVAELNVYEEQEVPEALKPFCTAHTVYEQSVYMEPIARKGRVYVFGGGHVGRALIPVLAAIDFKVVVYDNRPELAVPENFPDAEAVLCGDYPAFEDQVHLSHEDYVVVMTPGHQADFEVVCRALKANTTYIGCIGSRAKIAATREKLSARGFSKDEIDRLHAPIGLPILAETPAEIAISVAAELIRHRKEHQDSLSKA